MIFRCSDFDSQAVTNRAFKQAIPPEYTPPTTYSPADGVLTPYFSYDCTIYRPKEPTTLPVDTCLSLEVGHTIFISQPAICANGKPAVAQTYLEESCVSPSGSLGDELDKKCHRTNARSVAFVCGESEMQMLEDLPAREEENVEPLAILALPPPKEQDRPMPEVGKQIPWLDDEEEKWKRELELFTAKSHTA